MNDEKFDIVDEHDNPIGRLTTKKEAHEKGYPHRVAAVLVFNDDGKLLVQEHRIHNRLLDHSVGGRVSAGESYLAAATRESKEELGLETELEEIALSVPAIGTDPRPEYTKIKHIYGVYKAQVPKGWVFKETDEVDSLIEMTIDEVIEMMNTQPERFLNGFFVTLNTYLRKINYTKKISAFGRNWSKL